MNPLQATSAVFKPSTTTRSDEPGANDSSACFGDIGKSLVHLSGAVVHQTDPVRVGALWYWLAGIDAWVRRTNPTGVKIDPLRVNRWPEVLTKPVAAGGLAVEVDEGLLVVVDETDLEVVVETGLEVVLLIGFEVVVLVGFTEVVEVVDLRHCE